MVDVKILIPSFAREVLVFVPDGGDLKEAFNEISSFVRTLEANNQIRDLEAGINPPSATYEIVKEQSGEYRLSRFRFS